MPELRFQLHSHLPRLVFRRDRRYPRRMRALPLYPVVLTNQLNWAERKWGEENGELRSAWRATGRIRTDDRSITNRELYP